MAAASVSEKKMAGKTRSAIPQKAPAALLAGLLVIGGIWFGFVRHEDSALKKATQALSTVTSADGVLRAQLAQAKANPGMLQQLYSEDQTAVNMLPTTPDPGFLTTLSNDAKSAGLSKESFSDSKLTTATGNLEYIPYQVSVTGSYTAVLTFMGSVTSNPELVTLTSVHLSQASGNQYSASINLDLWADSTKPAQGGG